MCVDADVKLKELLEKDPEARAEWEKDFKLKNDPRITRSGAFLRKTSLDELPQIFNVIRGEMSLVGPRPERPQFVEKFKEEIPRYMIKHQVRPGMTGLAQINGFRGDTSIWKRVEYDIEYIENWTIWLDIKIIFSHFSRALLIRTPIKKNFIQGKPFHQVRTSVYLLEYFFVHTLRCFDKPDPCGAVWTAVMITERFNE